MIVVIAVAMAVLMGFGALAIDTSMLYLENTRLQTALDASVLAGATLLPDTGLARLEAEKYLNANGFSADGVEFDFENNNMVITASGTKAVGAGFSSVFGRKENTVNALASAEKTFTTSGFSFDYLLFTDDAGFTLKSSDPLNIWGNVHANGSLNFSSSWHPAGYSTIGGRASAVHTATVHNSYKVLGGTSGSAPKEDMPDIAKIEQNLKPSQPLLPGDLSTYTVLNPANIVPGVKQVFTGNTYITGSCTFTNETTVNGNLYVDGKLTIQGTAPVCELNGTIYATGDISFGNSFRGKGNVFSGGSITFVGSYIDNDGIIYALNNISLGNAFISKGSIYAGGNITISGYDCTLDGCNIFAGGTLTSGAAAHGKGNIFAKGSIAFNSYEANLKAGDMVCVFSANGNIDIKYQRGRGVLFAPNGKITWQGYGGSYYGHIIGKQVTIPGKVTIYPLEGEPDFMGNALVESIKLIR